MPATAGFWPSSSGLVRRFDLFEQSVDARFNQFEQSVDSRFALLEQSVDSRFNAFDLKLDAQADRLAAVFRKELNDAITAQTRTVVFGMLGMVVALGSLMLGLVGLA